MSSANWIVAQPGSIKKVAVAALFKLRSSGFDKEECKECLKSLPDDLEAVGSSSFS